MRQNKNLQILAFVSGFTLMAYELVAARILAPTIGSSMYVWTSVIGVIIAALSVGYFLGGRLADKRAKEVDVAFLHIFAAAAVTWTLLIYEPLLSGVAGTNIDARLQGVLASLVLFAPASVLLGMISPYLAKLNVTSLKTSGRAIASLSALNSIGGIAGTFVTGFILFGYVGSRESMVLFVALLLIASWLSVYRKGWRLRLALTLVIVATSSLILIQPQEYREIDTASAHYRITEQTTPLGDKVRLLLTGPSGAQSGVVLGNSSSLIFWYTNEIVDIIEQIYSPGDSIAILGGGAYTLPNYLARQYPESKVTTIEIDPELVDIAESYFEYSSEPNEMLVSADARAYINKSSEKHNIVVIDVYGDISVPFSLLTREYGDAINRIVASDGVVIVNIIAAYDGPCAPLFDATHATYDQHFSWSYRVKSPGTYIDQRSNIIAVYSKVPLVLNGLTEFNLEPTSIYTDNFMPAERLQQSCKM
jgi:predicted membrane-bound spermidine synthase